MSLLDAILLDPAPFEVWIAIRTDGIKGSGTASDPFNGSTVATFDARMSELPSNTRVLLGPGTFSTTGFKVVGSIGWQLKTGLKIVGSGMEVTKLQMTGHSAAGYYYLAGHDLTAGVTADFCEISDLTIDCALASAGASVACGAVRLMGNHSRIHRVRVINWGSKDTAKAVSALSCISALPDLGVPEIANCGIDSCVVVSPAPTPSVNVASCTAIKIGAPDGTTFIGEGHGKAPYIRNCFVDCGVATPNPDATISGKLRGLSMAWCRGGVVEGNHVYNADIGGPYQDAKSNTRDIIIRNNFYKNVGRGPYWNLGGLANETGPGALSRSGSVGTVSGLSSFSPYAVGARVKLVTSPADYTGVYIIRSTTATSFTITVPANSTLVTVSSAKKIFCMDRAIIEGNVIELTADPNQVANVRAFAVADANDTALYSELPDYVHEQVIIRNNKIRYVDGAAPSDATATHIDLKGIRNVIVQNNVLDTIATAPVLTARCGTESYFDNRTAAGDLLAKPGFSDTDFDATLQIPSDDAFVLAQFSHQ